jgi:hypothetical protein
LLLNFSNWVTIGLHVSKKRNFLRVFLRKNDCLVIV